MLEKKIFILMVHGLSKIPNDIEVINPATEKSCAVISLASKEDVNDAVLSAKEAFKTQIFNKQDRVALLETFYTLIKKDGTILLMPLSKKWEHQKILRQNFKLEQELVIQNHL